MEISNGLVTSAKTGIQIDGCTRHGSMPHLIARNIRRLHQSGNPE
jgi:hypothetical protein